MSANEKQPNQEHKDSDIQITEEKPKKDDLKESLALLNDLVDSPNKSNKKGQRRRSTIKRKLFERPDFVEQILSKEALDTLDLQNSSLETYKVLLILTQKYHRRVDKENELLFSFITRLKLQDAIKGDLLETDLQWKEMYSIIEPYIFGKLFNYYDTIFYNGDESDLLYGVINGKVGRYSLVESTEIISSEDYFLFLYNCRKRYQNMLKDGPYKNNIKIQNTKSDKKSKKKEDKSTLKKIINAGRDEEENKLELKDDEYIDEHLLKQIVEKNSEAFSLHSYDDIDNLNEIIFKLKLSSLLRDGKSVRELFEKFKFPMTFLGFDKVADHEVPAQVFLQKLNKNLGVKGHFYMKQLELINQQVKIMKYVRKDILTPYTFFGNFELIDCFPKRKYTTRVESENCLLLCLDKKVYSSILYEKQKNKREKEVNLFHADYLFKNININYFTTKIFSHFKIKNLFKGDILFKQDKTLDHFILVKEGEIELSLQNLSFLELNKLIKNTKDILVAGAKKYRMDIDELLNFNMEIDSRTTVKYSIIKEVINQKQNFIFSLNKKGFFGEYELFFGIPSLLTGTVASDSCKVYYYDFEKYKNLNEETYILNEGLKQNSFFKLKTILKRMINIYNSYWKICHGMLNKKEKENEELINIKNNEEMELIKKKAIKIFDANASAKVNPNLKDIYISHTSLNNSEYKMDDFENFIKLYLNKNNSGVNGKFFRTSLDNIKNRNKSQKNNKYINNNMKLVKNPKNIQLMDKSNNKDEKKENIYKRSFDNFKNNLNHATLLKKFKQTMNAQRNAVIKQHKKVFLPPILKVPEKLYKYKLFKTESYKVNSQYNYDRDIDNSIDNSVNKSLDKSINKSYSRSYDKSFDKSKSMNRSINNYNDKSNMNNSGSRSKSKRKIKLNKLKTLSLKVAQFNSMRYREDILKKRNPNLFKIND